MNKEEIEESKEAQTPVSDIEQALPEASNQHIVNEAEIQIHAKSPQASQEKSDEENFNKSDIEEEDRRTAEKLIKGPETNPKAATFEASNKLLRTNTANKTIGRGISIHEAQKQVPEEKASLLKDKGANEQTTR